MNRSTQLINSLNHRILLLDGAMGSLIQQYGLTEEDFRGNRFANHQVALKGNNDILSITRPDIIRAIHEQYLIAGSDIIETNTFNSNSISQVDYQTESFVYEINKAAAQLACNIAQSYSTDEKPRFVAGSMGPTGKSASMSPDINNPGVRAVSFDDLADAYSIQVAGLLDGGVDILLVETVFDTLNAKAALFGIEQELKKRDLIDFPVMISVTLADSGGRTLSGQTLEAFLISVSHFPLLSIGLNCSFGAAEMRAHIEELGRKTSIRISAYPNAGLPNVFGEYDETPDVMSVKIEDYIKNRLVNIIGGCCGTTPAHIAAFAKYLINVSPRTTPFIASSTRLSGLEALTVGKESNFVNIGERTNVAGSKQFAQLIRDKNYDGALSIARKQVEAGAQIIDINMDDAMLDAQKEMVTFLNLIASEPDIARVPVMIDSSRPEVLEAGLKCLQGKSIVNSISLKEGEERFLQQASLFKMHGAAVVVMAFDETGQADTFKRRIEICGRSYKLLTEKINFPPCDIIFDPNILAIATGIEEHNSCAVDFIETVRWIKQNLPHTRVSGGVSNLSFAFRGNNTIREAMHSVFLYHAIKAGMDMGIVNTAMLQIYDNIEPELLQRVEDVVLNRRPDATERLIEFAGSYNGKTNTDKNDSKADRQMLSIEKRLEESLIKGIVDYLKDDIAEAQKKYRYSLEIIEGPLMKGMTTVGELFGAGKMFLPQVVKTARVMRQAVEILQPFIEKEKSENETVSSKAGKILLATVKGDVHDIGKNIVGVILACNNYEVIDLGVMISAETIVAEAIACRADIIGLSGLITPSLEEMTNVAKEMERQGLNIPLMIGGATTSGIHTAVKIAPAYKGTVVHVHDASKSVPVANSLMSKRERETFISNLKETQHSLRQKHEQRNETSLLSIDEANQKRFVYDNNTYRPCKVGIKRFRRYPISKIIPLINWKSFFNTWKITGDYTDIEQVNLNITKEEWLSRFTEANTKAKANEALKLYGDAQRMLKKIKNNRILTARAVIGIFGASAIENNCIVVNKSVSVSNDDVNKKRYFFNCIRQQDNNNERTYNFCLSDFISKDNDFIGTFVATISFRDKKFAEICNNYDKLLLQTISDRLAEAFSELLHYKVRTKWWGYAPDEPFDKENILKGKYQGIRPAIGYACCPDHSEKRTLFDLLDVEQNIGTELTENFAMNPASSVCGFYIAHPDARYFNVGRIGYDQFNNLAKRKAMPIEELRRWIAGT